MHYSMSCSCSLQDDEGREVAIKVGKQEKHSSGPESLMKSYAEVRVEVTVLKRLCHEHVIEFLGVRLQPLGFLIEWAPLGGFHTILKSYFKSDARISPWVLCETARQVSLLINWCLMSWTILSIPFS